MSMGSNRNKISSNDSNGSMRSSMQGSSVDTSLAGSRQVVGKSSSFKKGSRKLIAATPIAYIFKGSSSGSKSSSSKYRCRSSRMSQEYLQEVDEPPPEGTDSIDSMSSFLSAITLPDSLRGGSLLPVPENDACSKFSSTDRDCRPRPPIRRQLSDA